MSCLAPENPSNLTTPFGGGDELADARPCRVDSTSVETAKRRRAGDEPPESTLERVGPDQIDVAWLRLRLLEWTPDGQRLRDDEAARFGPPRPVRLPPPESTPRI